MKNLYLKSLLIIMTSLIALKSHSQQHGGAPPVFAIADHLKYDCSASENVAEPISFIVEILWLGPKFKSMSIHNLKFELSVNEQKSVRVETQNKWRNDNYKGFAGDGSEVSISLSENSDKITTVQLSDDVDPLPLAEVLFTGSVMISEHGTLDFNMNCNPSETP